MRARIFQRPKTAMQSGVAGTQNWVLDFAPTRPEVNDPLMGWWGRGDTLLIRRSVVRIHQGAPKFSD